MIVEFTIFEHLQLQNPQKQKAFLHNYFEREILL
jgi:hypothetical protein